MAREQKREPVGFLRTSLPASDEQMLDELVTGPMTHEAVQDTFMLLKKAIIEWALGAELGHHLGYGADQARPDRDGSFAPILMPKHERRFTAFDDKIIAMYARA